MATNCLKTALKAAVDNENLSYFGKLRIHVTIPNNYTTSQRHGMLPIVPSENAYELTILDDDKFFTLYDAGSTQTKTISSGQTCIFPVGEYDLTFSNKYKFKGYGENPTSPGSNSNMLIPGSSLYLYAKDMQKLQVFNGSTNNDETKRALIAGDVSKISECDSIYYVNFGPQSYGQLNPDALPSLQILKFKTGSSVEITTADMAKFTSLTTINTNANVTISGNISELAPLYRITEFRTYDTLLTGNFDNLLTAWSTAGGTQTVSFMIGNWNNQTITSVRLSQYLNGTTHSVKLNGDGTWDFVS